MPESDDDKIYGKVTSPTGWILREIFKVFVSEGVFPHLRKYLEDEIRDGDKGRILRAFHDAIYSRRWSMYEAVPALKSFLENPNPYVRLNAAHDLYTVGDQSGYSTLLALVQSKDPIPGLPGGEDVRVEAATVLAQFRQIDATQAIYELYQQTKTGELVEALLTLTPSRIGALIPQKEFYSEATSIRFYGLENEREFLPQISAAFYNTQKPDVKVASAYALASMTGNQEAIDYLIEVVKSGNEPQGQGGWRDSVSYLGALQVPQAKETLEAVLDSKDTTTVQRAIVSLIYNQGGSEKAVQVIANQLNDSSHARLPWDFTLNMATQLLDDPKIQAAGQIFFKNGCNGRMGSLYSRTKKLVDP